MSMAVGLKILNLGCGTRFYSAHTNLDFTSSHPTVRACDLAAGIPFADGQFDVVYHSHVLEHFSEPAGRLFLKECARVLKSAGIIRVVVPDLEGIARAYLATLRNEAVGSKVNAADHEWMLLELYDQAVRTKSGGGMREFLLSPQFANREFVRQRVGTEALKILDAAIVAPRSFPAKFASVCRWRNVGRLYQKLATKMAAGVAWLLLGNRGRRSFEHGWFRTGGEIHQAMYDFVALERALCRTGFERVVRRDHLTSYVPGWREFSLDHEADGLPYKPDSLYAEALKP